MEKMSIGRRRADKKTDPERRHGGDWLTVLGMGGMAVILALTMGSGGGGSEESQSDIQAVAVMSVVSETAETLVKPEKETYVPENDSIFESIGEFFASLLFGEG